MKQIVISAVISSAISFLIINHEIIREKVEDITDWIKSKLGK